MRVVRVPDFRVPDGPRHSAWAVVLAIAVNMAVIGTIVAWSRGIPPNDRVFDGLAGLFDNYRELEMVQMVFLTPMDPQPTPGGAQLTAGVEEEVFQEELLPQLPLDEVEGAAAEEEAPAEEPVPLVEDVPTEAPTELTDIIARTVLDDTLPRPTEIGTRRRLGPSYGDGRVWAPIVLTEGERVILAVSVAAIDSLMRDRLIAAITALPSDSFAMQNGPREWATQIGGQDIGINEQFITLGPLKVPTFLLAFLPLDLPEGNIFDQRDKRRYEEIRQQIVSQSQRMADGKRVKQFIAEMRERMDDERARKLAEGMVSDSLVARRDSIIPER